MKELTFWKKIYLLHGNIGVSWSDLFHSYPEFMQDDEKYERWASKSKHIKMTYYTKPDKLVDEKSYSSSIMHMFYINESIMEESE